MSESKTRNEPRYHHINAAFARAAREQHELQRLKAQHPQYGGLYFHPERLGVDSATDTATSNHND